MIAAVTGICLPAVLVLQLDLGYYLHLARGQARLLLNEQPLGEALADRSLDARARGRLRLFAQIRQFAESEIGLSPSENYTTFCDVGEGPVCWNLTACPRDRLVPVRWKYPVVGSAPYRGYFDLPRAQKEQARLENQGYDTYLRPVSAYSTLGWFRDPILSTMLEYSELDLADLVIHELTHATVWVPGDVAFNESLATFVGETGSLLWLRARYGEASLEMEHALGLRQDRRRFGDFMRDLAAELDQLYGSDVGLEEKLAGREEVFREARKRLSRIPMATGAYAESHRWTLNNARLAAYRVYHDAPAVFSRVLAAVGGSIGSAVDVFRGCEETDDPQAYLAAWLRKRD